MPHASAIGARGLSPTWASANARSASTSTSEHVCLNSQAVATTRSGRSGLGTTATPSTRRATPSDVELVVGEVAVLEEHAARLERADLRRPGQRLVEHAGQQRRRVRAGPDVGGSVRYSGSAPPARTCWRAGGIERLAPLGRRSPTSAAVVVVAAADQRRTRPRRRARRRPPSPVAGAGADARPLTSAMPAMIERAADEHAQLELLVEHDDADDDGDDRDHVGDERRPGGAEVGDDPVVEEVGEPGADDAEQRRWRRCDARLGSKPSLTLVTRANGASSAAPAASWPAAATAGGMPMRCARIRTKARP